MTYHLRGDVTDPSSNFRASRALYALPVQRGLVGFFDLGGSEKTSVRNLAAPDLPSGYVVGEPGYAANYASFKSRSNYLVTNVAETTALSIMLVCRSTDTLSGASNLPVFASTFGGDYLTPTPAGDRGLRLYASAGSAPTITLRGNHAITSGSPAAISQVGPLLSGVNPSAFLCLSLTITAAGVGKLRNLTAATSSTNTPGGTRLPNLSQPIALGSDFSGSFLGTCDVAYAMLFNVDLTDAEIDAAYAWQKALAAAQGMVI